jgi:uncharacterized membrane protein YfcA
MIELIIIGILVGTMSGFFGLGGGTVLVPMLMIAGFDIKEAIGISVMQMVFSSIYGSYLNHKKGLLKIDEGIFVGFGGFVGALFSGLIVSTLSSHTLELIFLAFVLFAIYKFVQTPLHVEQKESSNKFILFLVGLFVGSFAISIGVGGSLLLTPILVGYLFYDMKRASSLGLFFVIFSSVSGFISLSYFGHINYVDGTIVGLLSLIGVYIGIQIKSKTDAKQFKNVVLGLYILVFCTTFYKAILEPYFL